MIGVGYVHHLTDLTVDWENTEVTMNLDWRAVKDSPEDDTIISRDLYNIYKSSIMMN